jgi:hypothetical protein
MFYCMNTTAIITITSVKKVDCRELAALIGAVVVGLTVVVVPTEARVITGSYMALEENFGMRIVNSSLDPCEMNLGYPSGICCQTPSIST